MLQIDSLKHVSIDKVPAGNLIYMLDSEGPELALRVEFPAAGGGAAYPGAVVIHGASQDRKAPITRADQRTQMCLDWGIKPTVLWKHPIKYLPHSVAPSPALGWICLVGNKPAITSCYSGGGGNRLYWDLLTGLSVDPGEYNFGIGEWWLGVKSADGKFLELAAFPRDYIAPSSR